jgi:hypothetical protein
MAMFEYSTDELGRKIYADSGKPVGRPREEIDTDMLMKLAQIQCTVAEIAYCMGVDKTTLYRTHKDAIEAGREMGKMRLRRSMWQNAIENNNVVMQIFLSKNVLGMKDNPDVDVDDATKPLPWTASEPTTTQPEAAEPIQTSEESNANT